MAALTEKQAKILQFIAIGVEAGLSPTIREVARHFKFKSVNSAVDHIKALIAKGYLLADEGKARSFRLASPSQGTQIPGIAKVPLYGSIPAGFGEEREQEPDRFIRVDISVIGFKPTARTFCLRVAGDSMIGKHICDGDFVILEHGPDPRNGDVVAALIDGKTTLKTFIQKGGKRFLKAENPKYPALTPSEELVIQGVLKAVFRRF